MYIPANILDKYLEYTFISNITETFIKMFYLMELITAVNTRRFC